MPRLFVTGTDTGVGKTRVAVGLCTAYAQAGRRVAAMKPVASGCTPTRDGLRNDDAMALLAAMTVRASYAEVNPYAYEPAIAPHIAAAEIQRPVEWAVLDRCFERLCLQSDVTIVEGAGGWLAPLSPGCTFADLAARWQLGVVLVIGLRLGCLNHALLTVESVKRHGLELRGWVANAVDADFERPRENLETLHALIAAPCWGEIPHSPHGTPEDAAKILRSRMR